MIIYQFHMLSNGEIKLSKAEYKESLDFKNIFCYKKVKVIEKGISKPKFPAKLYKLGEYNYNKFYALSIDELSFFINDKIKNIENAIKKIEFQLKKYQEMTINLKEVLK